MQEKEKALAGLRGQLAHKSRGGEKKVTFWRGRGLVHHWGGAKCGRAGVLDQLID